MNTQRKNSLLLLLCAFIWGTAFVAQSAGSGMGACSFLAGRSWLAVLVLLPTVKVFDLVRQRSTGTTGAPKTPEERRCLRRASLVCGTLLFVASAAQQFGLTLNPSTAKAGFLTAMYVVLVPIFGLALGRRGSPQLWLSVAIAVCGLYLLCSGSSKQKGAAHKACRQQLFLLGSSFGLCIGAAFAADGIKHHHRGDQHQYSQPAAPGQKAVGSHAGTGALGHKGCAPNKGAQQQKQRVLGLCAHQPIPSTFSRPYR